MSFTGPRQFASEIPPNIPIELLTVDDITNISAAVEEPIEEAPEVQEEVVEELPTEPEPQELAALPDPVLELPAPEAEFLPEEDAEPEPVEAEPDPEPTPVPDPGAIQPVMRPRPPERQQDFDFSQAAALIDRAPRDEEPAFDLESLEIGDNANVEVADRARSRVGLGTGLTISEIDALRAQIYPCWNFPSGVPNPEDMNVVLEVRLNRDGTLARPPAVLDVIRFRTDRYFRTVSESAVRAITICERGQRRLDGSVRTGFDLPPERYSEWERLEIEFNLASAMGLR